MAKGYKMRMKGEQRVRRVNDSMTRGFKYGQEEAESHKREEIKGWVAKGEVGVFKEERPEVEEEDGWIK